MKYYYREKEWLYLGFDYDPDYIASMKKFNAQFNYATNEWTIPLSLEFSILIKEFIDKEGFVKDRPELPMKISLRNIEPIIDEKSLESLMPGTGLSMKLRDYQLEGLAYMINHENCINGCGCGLGKTFMSIAYAELLNTFPCIIVCPSSVKEGWKKEWLKCNPNRKVYVIDAEEEIIDWKSDVIVINYDYLHERKKSKSVNLRYKELSKNWSLAIFDEIHLCKNSKSIRSKAVKKLAKKSLHKLALSGTLIMNRPQELINVLEILNQFEDIFPDLRYYLYRYCNAKVTRYGLDAKGASNTRELHKIISHYCYFRKERRDVLTELPPIIEQFLNASITNKKEYVKAETDFIKWLKEIDLEAAERAERAEHLVRLANLKKLSLKGKLKYIIQFLKDWQESDEENKIIVFGNLTEPLEELHKAFKDDSVLVTGKSSSKEKLERVELFKEEKQFLFANLQTLSTGVDGLQKCCHNMAFIEWPSRPSDLEQAMSRIDRMGQEEKMNVYHLLSEETIDEEVKILIKEKICITDAVNKGVNVVSTGYKSIDWEVMKKIKERNENP